MFPETGSAFRDLAIIDHIVAHQSAEEWVFLMLLLQGVVSFGFMRLHLLSKNKLYTYRLH